MDTNERLRAADDMATNPESAFVSPPAREKITARVEAETKDKLHVIMEIWRAQAKADRQSSLRNQSLSGQELEKRLEEAAGDVDLTYVIARILARGCDTELALWGGYPDTPEKLKALLATILSKK